MQEKLQEIASSIRRPAYLPERMFPQLRERIGPALDLVVEFSTLGEYRLNADGVLCAASALTCASEREPQMGGAGATRPEAAGSAGCAGYGTAARAAVRRIVAGGAAGSMPAATPAARRPRCEREPAREPEQLCLAV